MRRREFFTLLGGAGALPFAAHAQQRSMPVIGFLGYDRGAPAVAAFSQGLRELGYTEGGNIRIEYRWAEGKPERFDALAAELVALKVNVIMSAGGAHSRPSPPSERRRPSPLFSVLSEIR